MLYPSRIKKPRVHGGAPAYHIRCLNGASQLLTCRASHCTDSSCWRSRCHGRCASGGDGRARVVIRSTTASREPRGDPRLIMEYGKALDQRDWPAFAILFAKNGGEWIGGMGPAKGRAAIQKLMEDTIEPSSRTNGATGTRVANVHVFSNETIDIRATLRTVSPNGCSWDRPPTTDPSLCFSGTIWTHLFERTGSGNSSGVWPTGTYRRTSRRRRTEPRTTSIVRGSR